MIQDPAARRTLRLAIGVSLALALGQAFNWAGNSIAAIITSALLTLPLPAPSLRFAVSFVGKIILSLVVGLLLLVPAQEQPVLGVMVVAVLLFVASYAASTSRIGPLDFALLLIGLLVIPALGATHVDLGVAAAKGITISALVVFPCVWVAYALLPEPLFHKIPVPPAAFESDKDAAIHALRPVLVVLPVYVWFFLADDTYAYAVVLVKAVLIAQQAENARGLQLAKDELMATVIGGGIAVAIWWLLMIWPSLFWYITLTFLSALVAGQRIFGEKGQRLSTHTWGYAFTTSIVINASAVLQDSFDDRVQTGDERYFSRVAMFLFVTIYGMIAVYVADEWIERRRRKRRAAREKRLQRREARGRGRHWGGAT